jgi:hypothetical protein
MGYRVLGTQSPDCAYRPSDSPKPLRVRIRLVIVEPVELLGEDHRAVTIVGEVTERLHDEGLPDRLRMKADMGAALGRRLIDSVVLQPRYTGHSVDELQQGQSLTVQGFAHPSEEGVEPLGFLGRASPI